MASAIAIPHLLPGQKISDFKKVYLAATALLDDKQKKALLPIYVSRSTGEQDLAHIAASKPDIKGAFNELEELIEGVPCRFAAAADFFSLLPADATLSSSKSFFFTPQKKATQAGVPTDI